MLKRNKKKLIISCVIILLPVVIGLLMWNILPDSMVTHWGVSGEANGRSSKAFAVFVIPLILLVLQWFMVLVTAKDPKNSGQSDKVFGMVLWILPMVSLLSSGTVYAIALGAEIGIDIFVRVLMGLMFVIIGNYMPKCKQNHTIGIKVTWTLKNTENWNKTHRFAGKIWVIGGLLILLTMFIPMESFVGAFVAIILVLAFVPMIYSYLYYRKQVKAGDAITNDGVMDEWEKKFTRISLVIGAVILILVAVFMVSGDFEVQYGEDSFTIEALYWSDVTIPYGEIEEIEYREYDKPGTRTFGFGSLKLLMGEFENSEFGDYTRYSYKKCDSCVVLTVKERVLVINGENEESTKNIYDELVKKMN